MSIVGHQLVSESQSGNVVYVTYRFTDHVGGTVDVNRTVPVGTNYDEEMFFMYAEIEEMQATQEVENALGLEGNPDRVAVYQAQNDFDRRVLGKLMTQEDVYIFYAALPFFQAVESRGGSNAVQRSAYLGVPKAEYDLVADRYGDVQGIAFFLDDSKNQVWDGVPEIWE